LVSSQVVLDVLADSSLLKRGRAQQVGHMEEEIVAVGRYSFRPNEAKPSVADEILNRAFSYCCTPLFTSNDTIPPAAEGPRDDDFLAADKRNGIVCACSFML
jgi:hypothetical protein